MADVEPFRPEFDRGYGDVARSSRPPFGLLMMFKILAIQMQNRPSDDQTVFLISDRLSFLRLFRLPLGDKIPGPKTIWLFRERLVKAGAMIRSLSRLQIRNCVAMWPRIKCGFACRGSD